MINHSKKDESLGSTASGDPCRTIPKRIKRMTDQQPQMCPNWDPTRPGKPFAQRSGLGEKWVFLGSIGMRTADFDPTTTRTTHPCARNACPNHSESGCSVASWASSLPAPEQPVDVSCPLTNSCRWRAEQGPGICQRCPAIIHWAVEPPQGMPEGLEAEARAQLEAYGPSSGPRVLRAFEIYHSTGDAEAALQLLLEPPSSNV